MNVWFVVYWVGAGYITLLRAQKEASEEPVIRAAPPAMLACVCLLVGGLSVPQRLFRYLSKE